MLLGSDDQQTYQAYQQELGKADIKHVSCSGQVAGLSESLSSCEAVLLAPLSLSASSLLMLLRKPLMALPKSLPKFRGGMCQTP